MYLYFIFLTWDINLIFNLKVQMHVTDQILTSSYDGGFPKYSDVYVTPSAQGKNWKIVNFNALFHFMGFAHKSYF